MNATIGTLLSVKKQMHNTLENFDSQKSLSNQTNILADKLNATMVGISGFGVSLGVFNAFDNIMAGIGNVSIAVIPEKVSLFLKRKFIVIQVFGYHHNMKVHIPDDQNHSSFELVFPWDVPGQARRG